MAKALAKMLKTLIGTSPHHILSTKDFVDRVSKITLQQGECICSNDVTALFTCVQVDPALDIIRELPEQDTTLWDRTVLMVQNIIELLGFCLHNTYFSSQNKIYEQVGGVAMGSPVSPIVANLYMKNFKKKGLKTTSTPRLWMRYVDDTFVIKRENQKQNILDQINNIGPGIKFTVEGNQENGTTEWGSHHNLAAKCPVVSTLTHRTKVVSTGSELVTKELHHLRGVLTKCKYPKWALDKVKRRIFNSWEDNNTQWENTEATNQPSTNTTRRDPNRDKHSKGHIVIPYT